MKLEEIVSRVSEYTDDAMLITEAAPLDAPGPRILWCNDALLSHTGYARDEVIGRSPRMFQGHGTDPETARRIGRQLRAWEPVREQILNYRKDGSSFWVDLSLRPVVDGDGLVRYWIGLQRDVTALFDLREELSKAQQSAEQAQQRLLSALETLPDAFAIFDRDDRLVLCNSRYREVYDLSAGAIRPGARFEDILRAGLENGQYPEAEGREEEWLTRRMDRHRAPSEAIEQELPGDRYLQIHEVRTPMGDTVGLRTDVTTLRRQKRALEEQAAAMEHAVYHDQLTDLPNRKSLGRELGRCLDRPKAQCRGLCVMHVDLDRFKEINDSLGHQVGDRVLQCASRVMTDHVREDDLVARVGGDEFVIVMDLAPDDREATAQRIADGLIAALRETMYAEGHNCAVGASIGIAFADDSHWQEDRMIGNADIALYEAKRRGKGRAVRFQPAMRSQMEHRHALIQEIESGVTVDEFVPYLQPKVSISDGSLVGFEVLTRWNHPTRGILAPPEFLHLVEETGLLQAIDRSVIGKALTALVDLRAAGWDIPHLAINAPAVSLRDPRYAADLQALAESHGQTPADLRVEVVEDTLIAEENDPALATLHALQSRGFNIELDDFGTGYASLSTLAKLQLTGLKVDLELVQDLDNPRIRKIAEAIAGLARNLKLQVTAEGVETASQYADLRAIGYDVVQGYCISAPLSVEDAEEWLGGYGASAPDRRPAKT